MQMHHQKIAMLPDSRVRGIMQSQATASRESERSMRNPSSDESGWSITETAFCVLLSIFLAVSLVGLALLLHAHFTGSPAPYRITQAIDVTPARARCLFINQRSPPLCYNPIRKMNYDLANTPWRRGIVHLRGDYAFHDHQDFLGIKDRYHELGWATNSVDEVCGTFESLPNYISNGYIGVYSQMTLDKILQDPGVLAVQDMPFDECYGIYLPDPWRDLRRDQTPIPDLLYHVLPKHCKGFGKSMASTRPTEARFDHPRDKTALGRARNTWRRDDYTWSYPSQRAHSIYEDARDDYSFTFREGHTLHEHLDHLGIQIVGHAGPHKWKACDPHNATRCGYLHPYNSEIDNLPAYDWVFDQDMARRAALDPGVIRIENWNGVAEFGAEPPECRDLERPGLGSQHIGDHCPPREHYLFPRLSWPIFNASSPTLHEFGAFFHEKNYTLVQHLDFLNLTTTSNNTLYPDHIKACDPTNSTRCGYFHSITPHVDVHGYWAQLTDEIGALAANDSHIRVVEKMGSWREEMGYGYREKGLIWPEDYEKVVDKSSSGIDDLLSYGWMKRMLPSDWDNFERSYGQLA